MDGHGSRLPILFLSLSLSWPLWILARIHITFLSIAPFFPFLSSSLNLIHSQYQRSHLFLFFPSQLRPLSSPSSYVFFNTIPTWWSPPCPKVFVLEGFVKENQSASCSWGSFSCVFEQKGGSFFHLISFLFVDPGKTRKRSGILVIGVCLKSLFEGWGPRHSWTSLIPLVFVLHCQWSFDFWCWFGWIL